MKSNTKEGVKAALFWGFFFTFLISVTDKIGLNRWKPNASPISWCEFFNRIPVYFGIALVTSLVVLFWWIVFRREPKYCIYCKAIVPRTVSDDSVCPKCNKETESLDGVFERHPELKDS